MQFSRVWTNRKEKLLICLIPKGFPKIELKLTGNQNLLTQNFIYKWETYSFINWLNSIFHIKNTDLFTPAQESNQCRQFHCFVWLTKLSKKWNWGLFYYDEYISILFWYLIFLSNIISGRFIALVVTNVMQFSRVWTDRKEKLLIYLFSLRPF